MAMTDEYAECPEPGCRVVGPHPMHNDLRGGKPWVNVENQARRMELKASKGRKKPDKQAKDQGHKDLIDMLGGRGRPLPASPLPNPGDNRPGQAHTDARDTEQAAADLVVPKSGTLRLTALQQIADRYPDDGLTDTELGEVTGEYRYTMAPRRVELMNDGWVIDSGLRRKSDHDRDEVVWSLSLQGAEQLGLVTWPTG